MLRGHQAKVTCLLVVSALVMAGCWDRVAVDELVIVLTLGLDTGSEPGMYAVTLEMINPGGSTSSESGEAGSLPPATLITREGRTVLEAIQAIQRSVDRGIFLGQLQIVLFGEDLARNGITGTLDHLQRDGQLRRTMNVAVARGTAQEVMRSNAPTFVTLGISLDALTIQAAKTGYVATLFGDFLQFLVEPGASAILPVFERAKDDDSLTVTGVAAFQDDRLIGIFDTPQSMGTALATNQAKSDLVLVAESEWDGERVLASFQLRKAHAMLDVQIVDGKIEATLNVQVEGVLAEQIGGGQFPTSKDWALLQGMQEKAVRQAVEAAIKQAQEWQTDVFRIGSRIEQRFPKEWKTLRDNWPETFSQLDIKAQVLSRLFETGLIKEPLDTRKGGD